MLKESYRMEIKRTVFIITSVAILSGCAVNKPTEQSSSYAGSKMIESEESRPNQRRAYENDSENTRRIVIYDASIKIVVKIPDSTNVKLAETALKYDGYVQTLGNKKSILRVKSDKLQSAIADISSLGKVKDKTISGNDVTDQFVDYQIRLDNARNARKRYLELLARAETVEAALKVEKELERLNGDIDSLEGKITQLKHLSEYSTITVLMEEKVKPGILGYIGIGLYESVKWIFVRN